MIINDPYEIGSALHFVWSLYGLFVAVHSYIDEADSIPGFDAAIQWKAFKHVVFVLANQASDLDLKVDDGDEFGGDLKYEYRGPPPGRASIG